MEGKRKRDSSSGSEAAKKKGREDEKGEDVTKPKPQRRRKEAQEKVDDARVELNASQAKLESSRVELKEAQKELKAAQQLWEAVAVVGNTALTEVRKTAVEDARTAVEDARTAVEDARKLRDFWLNPLRAAEEALGVDEQPAHKKAKTSTVVKDEDMTSIAQNLDIDTWQGGGLSLDICLVEPDFPHWLYVRKETLDIIKIFKAQMEANLNIVFKGTPGVGKSILVVLFAIYMAVRQRKRVVLFRKQKGKGFSLLYMDGENGQYWRMGRATISDLDVVENQDFELCLDGLEYDDVRRHFETLARFRLLAISVQYPMKNNDTPVIRQCLVPFWSLSDLNAIGAHRQWSKHEINTRYFYSGGNLRGFSSAKELVTDSIDQATRVVDSMGAQLLNTQFGGEWDRQVDRLRMTGIQANDRRELGKYLYCANWICVITSEYALRRLGNIVRPCYYKELWSKGRTLGDDGLMGIAFENYVHALARDGKTIELQVRAYDRAKARQHTYAALNFEAKSCRSDGMNATECDAVMEELSTSSDDYWYPSSRSLATIDCVAKLSMEGKSDAVGLIQITTSDHHNIDSNALDKYAMIFPGRSIYIALVPDKETCDEFRLSPANPPTEVPLNVAYITTWGL